MAESEEVGRLRAEVDHLGQLLVQANDAAFVLAGILSKIVVTEGLVAREALAHAIELRAGSPGAEDFNPLLMAFARTVRMNLPGGRFEVIHGGKNEVDPD